jgi:uracil-DNA glycosylase family 4
MGDPGSPPFTAPSPALLPVHQAIIACERCPRLRRFCRRVARVKRAAYRDVTYWGRPVPGFGDPAARMLIIGLAPAAHGANRTGRVFTGDGGGGSGDFLMRALFVNGLASIPTSQHVRDGLTLKGAYIAAAVRCAPPDNRPTASELARCRPHLEAEWSALDRVRVVVCLGRVAFTVCWEILQGRGLPLPKPRPAFVHGASYAVDDRLWVLAAYHPSRQNTNTGRLTAPMLEAVFARARELSEL